MDFRRDINGLRALAVAAVVAFHFGIPGMGGGFAGVDVFFVISGYLMTGIIYRRLERNTFSLWNFYLDRGRRILPALAVMCGILLVAGWMFLFPSDYKALGKYVASAIFFISNIAFFQDTGYFDTAPTEKWLLHTWSLSVEWQFYIVYPLILAGLRKWVGDTKGRIWLAVIGLVSFVLSVVLSKLSPAAAFYLLPTRAWEMIVGGLVFLYPVVYGSFSKSAVEWCGLGLIIASCVLFTHGDVWPGWLALIPVVGTALVISAANQSSILLGNNVTQFIGRCSYSIYLWHWPIVVGLHYSGKTNDSEWIVAAILLSALLGWLSMRYVENQMRSTPNTPASARIGNEGMALITIVGITAALGAGVFFLQGVPQAVRAVNEGERSKFIESYVLMHKTALAKPYHLECDFYDWTQRTAKRFIEASCTQVQQGQSVFIWGDSHAQALSEGIRNLLSPAVAVAQVATSGCAPSLGTQLVAPTIDNNCDRSNAFALSEIARLRPETVLIAQRRDHEHTDWREVSDRLHVLGVKNVVLMGPLPSWKPSLPSVVARSHWFDRSPYVSHGLDEAAFDTDRLLRERWGDSKNVIYVSLIEKLCRSNGCVGVLPGTNKMLIAVDYAHLTVAGSNYVAQTVLRERIGKWYALRP